MATRKTQKTPAKTGGAAADRRKDTAAKVAKAKKLDFKKKAFDKAGKSNEGLNKNAAKSKVAAKKATVADKKKAASATANKASTKRRAARKK